MKLLRTGCVAVTAGLTVGQAVAASGGDTRVWGAVTASAGGQTFSKTYDNFGTPGDSLSLFTAGTSGPYMNALPGSSFAAVAEARAGAGSLGIETTALAEGMVTGGVHEVTAGAFASFLDTVTVSGAPQIRVRLQAEMAYNFTVEAEKTHPTTGGVGSAWGGGAVYGLMTWSWLTGSAGFVACSGNVAGYGCANPHDAGTFSSSIDITLFDGDQITLYSTMVAQVGAGLYNAGGDPQGGKGWASADAYRSLRNGITVLTEGATLNAASGHDYVFVPHVPEPSTYALMMAGLLAVGCVTRRHNS